MQAGTHLTFAHARTHPAPPPGVSTLHVRRRPSHCLAGRYAPSWHALSHSGLTPRDLLGVPLRYESILYRSRFTLQGRRPLHAHSAGVRGYGGGVRKCAPVWGEGMSMDAGRTAQAARRSPGACPDAACAARGWNPNSNSGRRSLPAAGRSRPGLPAGHSRPGYGPRRCRCRPSVQLCRARSGPRC